MQSLKLGDKMVIDIHCHILPNVDDGARSDKIMFQMLHMAAEEEIDAIVATPHFICGAKKGIEEEIKKKYEAACRWLQEMYPDKQLFLGSEIYYSDGVVEALEQGLAFTMNGTRYILIEFPGYVEFGYVRKAIQQLLYAGYMPVIAHVERYKHLKRGHVKELVDMGAYIQVNTSSIIGKQGFREKLYVYGLLRKRLVHFIGTDAHGLRERRPDMKKCRCYLEKKIGKAEANRILSENPTKMLRGEKIDG